MNGAFQALPPLNSRLAIPFVSHHRRFRWKDKPLQERCVPGSAPEGESGGGAS
jgi:hypothetical protein